MTNDFIDDAVDLLEESGRPYVIVYMMPDTSSGRVCSNVEKWKPVRAGTSVRDDVVQLLDSSVFSEENET